MKVKIQIEKKSTDYNSMLKENKIEYKQEGGKISDAELLKMAGYKTSIGGKPVQYGIAPAVGMGKGVGIFGAAKNG
jgi:hypothetical protein